MTPPVSPPQIAAKLEPLSAEQRDRAAMAGPRPPSGCTIFLGFTSNLVSSGVRESIRYLVQHSMVTAGTGDRDRESIRYLVQRGMGDVGQGTPRGTG